MVKVFGIESNQDFRTYFRLKVYDLESKHDILSNPNFRNEVNPKIGSIQTFKLKVTMF